MKASDSHSRVISTCRDTTLPFCSNSSCKIFHSFRVSSTRCPFTCKLPSAVFSTASPQRRRVVGAAKS